MQNGNGRVYPKKILERDEELHDAGQKNRALGELDHPDSVINLKNASHMVTGLGGT